MNLSKLYNLNYIKSFVSSNYIQPLVTIEKDHRNISNRYNLSLMVNDNKYKGTSIRKDLLNNMPYSKMANQIISISEKSNTHISVFSLDDMIFTMIDQVSIVYNILVFMYWNIEREKVGINKVSISTIENIEELFKGEKLL